MICRAINLSQSTYFSSVNRGLSNRAKQDQIIKKEILEIYTFADKRFGAYKINNKLEQRNINISIGKTYRLLSTMNLPTIFTKKPNLKTAKPDNNLDCPNLINGNFNTSAPNVVWVSDITYTKVNGHKAFICIILDLFARKIIAYKCSSNMKKELVMETFANALKNRNYPKNVIFHSDRGSQYTSKAFRQMIDIANFHQSFSKPGYPYDNAVAECFFKYFKQGEINRRCYRTMQDLEISTFVYIEKFYNSYNPHSYNNDLTPNQKEELFFQNPLPFKSQNFYQQLT